MTNVFLVGSYCAPFEGLSSHPILSRPSTLSASEKNRPLIKVYSRESARPLPLFPGCLWNNRARHRSLFNEKWLMKCKVCLSSLLPGPERNSGSRTMEQECAGPQKAMASGWGRIGELLRLEGLESPSREFYLLISVSHRCCCRFGKRRNNWEPSVKEEASIRGKGWRCPRALEWSQWQCHKVWEKKKKNNEETQLKEEARARG